MRFLRSYIWQTFKQIKTDILSHTIFKHRDNFGAKTTETVFDVYISIIRNAPHDNETSNGNDNETSNGNDNVTSMS